MKGTAIALGLLAVGTMILLTPLTASGDCRWTWDCSGGYPCRQVEVCDNPSDLPPIQPPQILPPTPMPNIQCVDEYVCNSIGTCGWVNVCR